MDFKKPKIYIILLLTFIIVFLMNYIGNPNKVDRLQNALIVGFSGAIGLAVGLYIYNKNKNDNNGDKLNFD